MNIEFKNNAFTESEKNGIASELNIISTTKRVTMPYMRDMGIENNLPEDNSPLSQNQYASDVIEQVHEWDERIAVSEILFENENEVRMVIEHG